MSSYIYIMSNGPKGTLYIGVTTHLARRIYEHKHKFIDGFSKKYNLVNLVYVEEYEKTIDAIAREKQLKNWHRSWKINLIESRNPYWNDLYESFL